MRRGRPRDEQGSALVELVWLGVILIVPVVYVVVSAFQVQQGAFATAGAARAAARAYALAPDDATGTLRARAAAQAVYADHRITDHDPDLSVSCDPAGDCRSGGSVITVSVSTTVPLPYLPDFLAQDRTGVRVEGTHTVPIGRYQEAAAGGEGRP